MPLDDKRSPTGNASCLLFHPVCSPKAWLYGIVVAVHRPNGATVPAAALNQIKSGSPDRNTTGGGCLKASQLVPALRLLIHGEGRPDVDQLRRRTLFGYYYERGLSEPLAQRWAEQLLAESSTRTLPSTGAC